jgi:hypothetical protein
MLAGCRTYLFDLSVHAHDVVFGVLIRRTAWVHGVNSIAGRQCIMQLQLVPKTVELALCLGSHQLPHLWE